jgi:UPF0148 protein
MWRSQSAVMFMDEEEMLKRMTRFLEQGCTMLASHHDCGAPLFRCKGEIICPVCSPKEDKASAVSAKPISDTPLIQEEKREPVSSLESSVQSALQVREAETSVQDEQVLAEGLLRQVLLHKLKELARGIDS